MAKRKGYGTHLPILDKVVPENSCAVEFGMGHYSTPFFLKRCRTLISIEMQSSEWYRKCLDEYRLLAEENGVTWTTEELIGPWQFLKYRFSKSPDVAFIDGHGKSRWGCVNLMMTLRVPIIVAHDVDGIRYRWDLVNPEGYTQEIFSDKKPWTAVWRLKYSD